MGEQENGIGTYDLLVNYGGETRDVNIFFEVVNYAMQYSKQHANTNDNVKMCLFIGHNLGEVSEIWTLWVVKTYWHTFCIEHSERKQNEKNDIF